MSAKKRRIKRHMRISVRNVFQILVANERGDGDKFFRMRAAAHARAKWLYARTTGHQDEWMAVMCELAASRAHHYVHGW